MIYQKPEIAVLGDAWELIHQTGQKTGSAWDGPMGINPAYDVDE